MQEIQENMNIHGYKLKLKSMIQSKLYEESLETFNGTKVNRLRSALRNCRNRIESKRRELHTITKGKKRYFKKQKKVIFKSKKKFTNIINHDFDKNKESVKNG